MNFSDKVETSKNADVEANSQTSDPKQEKEVQTPEKQTSEKNTSTQEVQTPENQTSEGLKRGSQPFPYYMNKTEMSKTNISIYPSI